MATDDDRKRLRFGHRGERGAVNAVRTLLEAHGLVVDEVDGRSDYGRDLFVDLTDNDAITGVVIGVQVKGVKAHILDGWTMPATDKDLRYWSDSSVPIVGVLWDRDTAAMRWANLSAHARTKTSLAVQPGASGSNTSLDPHRVVFREDHQLDDSGLPAMLRTMGDYTRQSAATSLLALFDRTPTPITATAGAAAAADAAENTDAGAQHAAVVDCWALGRTDARAFTLLRRAVLDLADEPLLDAIIMLSHLVPHPDIAWTDTNWISQQIKIDVVATLSWSPTEIVRLVEVADTYAYATDTPVWTRGGIGQCVWCLLIADPNLTSTLTSAIELAGADVGAGPRPHTAATLTWLLQYLADDPAAALAEAARLCPAISTEPLYIQLVSDVREFGYADLW